VTKSIKSTHEETIPINILQHMWKLSRTAECCLRWVEITN